MKLGEARSKFLTLRQDATKVIVHKHSWQSHPERLFSAAEVKTLAMTSQGILHDNHVANPAAGSFVWWCRDAEGRQVELTIVFNQLQGTGEIVVVISAFRRL